MINGRIFSIGLAAVLTAVPMTSTTWRTASPCSATADAELKNHRTQFRHEQHMPVSTAILRSIKYDFSSTFLSYPHNSSRICLSCLTLR